MSVVTKILYHWHIFRMNYHRELHNGCLDETIKAELKCKWEIHQQKLDQLIGTKKLNV